MYPGLETRRGNLRLQSTEVEHLDRCASIGARLAIPALDWRRDKRLFADPRLLRRALCNLISNAIKHNGPDTRVRLDAQVAESRTEVVFSCRDDGVGIPPEVLPSIFNEFAGTNDSSGDSTGLGLAFCKAVVEAHGGRIWCESTPHGARFFFTIPLHKEPDSVSQTSVS